MNHTLQKDFFRYVFPSMLAFALSGIYAIADGFFVGNALGDHALAAINIAYPLTAFLQAVGTGIGMGGAIQYAIHLGIHDLDTCKRYFGMSILGLLASGVLLTALFLGFAPFLLHIFGASGEIQTLAEEYIQYIAYGAIFQILGTGLVPFIRNMGSSITAMIAMIAGFITNIILDYLFVWRFSWGMMGAAVATVIGQAMTVLVCLLFFLVRQHRPSFSFAGQAYSLLKTILQVGLSPFGLTFSPNITLILVNKSAALSSVFAVTCYAPISYISAVILLLLQGVSDGCQPLISLAYGKKEPTHIQAIRTLAYRVSFMIALLCMACLFAVRKQAAALFGASAAVTEQVACILPLFLIGYLFASISRVTTAYFYATNQNLWAYLLIYGEPIGLFLLLLILPQFFGVTGTWIAVPLSQCIVMLLSLVLRKAVKPPFASNQEPS